MPVVNVKLNQIPISLICDTSINDNILYCRPLDENLHNIGIITLKDSEIIGKYIVEEDECKYLFSNVNGEDNIKFKLVEINDESLPFSTITLNSLKACPISVSPSLLDQSKEESALSCLIVAAPPKETKIVEVTTSVLSPPLKENVITEKQPLLPAAMPIKLLVPQTQIIDKLAEYKATLLGEYFKISDQQLQSLEEYNSNTLKTLISNFEQQITNKFNENIENSDYLLTEKTLSLSELVTKNTAAYLKEYEQNLLSKFNTNSTLILNEFIDSQASRGVQLIQEEVSNMQTNLKDTLNIKTARIQEFLDKSSIELQDSASKLNKFIENQASEGMNSIQEQVNSIQTDFKETLNIETVKIQNFLEKSSVELQDRILDINKKISECILEKNNYNTLDQKHKKYTDAQFATAVQLIKKYAAEAGGGGSVAQQFANGGTMHGTLNVTGSILSAGVNLSDILTNSKYDSTYTTVNANSAAWSNDNNSYTIVQNSSANWNSSFTTVNANSANWISDNSAYTTVQTSSALWNTASTVVETNSASWNSVYSNVNANSAANIANITTLQNASGSWNNTTTTVNTNSANWTGASTTLRTLSALLTSSAFVDTTNASNITAGTLNVARIPTGTTNATVVIGNDTRIPVNVTGIRKSAGVGSTDVAATQTDITSLLGSGSITPQMVSQRTTFSNADAILSTGTRYLGQIGTMSASRTVTLPAASAVPAGYIVTISDDSGTVTTVNTIAVTCVGADTINGASSTSINTAYGNRQICSDTISKWSFDGSPGRLGVANTWQQNQIFNGTNNTSPNQVGVTPSASTSIVLDQLNTRFWNYLTPATLIFPAYGFKGSTVNSGVANQQVGNSAACNTSSSVISSAATVVINANGGIITAANGNAINWGLPFVVNFTISPGFGTIASTLHTSTCFRIGNVALPLPLVPTAAEFSCGWAYLSGIVTCYTANGTTVSYATPVTITSPNDINIYHCLAYSNGTTVSFYARQILSAQSWILLGTVNIPTTSLKGASVAFGVVNDNLVAERRDIGIIGAVTFTDLSML